MLPWGRLNPPSPRPFPALLLLLIVALPGESHAFDYLEHSYFTDRACRTVQGELARAAASDPKVGTRYLALSLFCPERWDRPYCAEGYKQLEGSLNRLAEPPAQSGDHPITLGDFAALADHLENVGPIGTVAQAKEDGLTGRLFDWLTTTGDAGGVISDVAEDACETDAVDWRQVEADVEAPSAAAPSSVERWMAAPFAPLARGVQDPSGAYSFDNPQYLDLVLRNHTHFGEKAYAAWLGFHTTAVDVSRRSCAELMALESGDLEDLSEGLLAFEALDWDALEPAPRKQKACALVAERLRLRVLEWSKRAAPELVEPVRSLIAQLEEEAPVTSVLAEALVPPVLSLVLEGSGLHFLQDGFSGGHVRMDRLAYGLEDSRHIHDADSRSGVAATRGTPSGVQRFHAWGDGYLLGTAPAGALRCTEPSESLSEGEVSACLLKHQRGLVASSTMASLIDWALEGEPGREGACEAAEDSPASWVCRALPTRATIGAGLERGTPPSVLGRGTMPPAPPPFSYQSLLISTGAELRGGPPQIGARAVFLSALGARANWMTSYDLGVLASVGPTGGVQGEFAYSFHWRWAARFLLHAGPFVFVGMEEIGTARSGAIAGVGPTFGLTLLPEGWIRMPLDFTVSYRMPMTLVDSRRGIGVHRFHHYLELSLGLAFF